MSLEFVPAIFGSETFENPNDPWGCSANLKDYDRDYFSDKGWYGVKGSDICYLHHRKYCAIRIKKTESGVIASLYSEPSSFFVGKFDFDESILKLIFSDDEIEKLPAISNGAWLKTDAKINLGFKPGAI